MEYRIFTSASIPDTKLMAYFGYQTTKRSSVYYMHLVKLKVYKILFICITFCDKKLREKLFQLIAINHTPNPQKFS